MTERVAPPPLPPELAELGNAPARGNIIAGHYELEEQLGSGGMGVVFRARHLHLNEHVAVKFIRPHLLVGRNAVRRFTIEAKALFRMRSPHAARVLDMGFTEKHVPFMVMELLEGPTLEAYLREHGPMAPTRAARCMLQVCSAVAEAHSLGIVHRDIKPGNILLQAGHSEDFIKVLDFGLAKVLPKATDDVSVSILTEHGRIIGTPPYMAPEQILAAAEVDERADIWAMGVVLSTLLSGSPPFDCYSTPWRAVLEELPKFEPAERFPKQLKALIEESLEKDRWQRIPNAVSFSRKLEAFLGERDLETGTATMTAVHKYEVSVPMDGSARDHSEPESATAPLLELGPLLQEAPHHDRSTKDATASLVPIRRRSALIWTCAAVLLGISLAWISQKRSRNEAPEAAPSQTVVRESTTKPAPFGPATSEEVPPRENAKAAPREAAPVASDPGLRSEPERSTAVRARTVQTSSTTQRANTTNSEGSGSPKAPPPEPSEKPRSNQAGPLDSRL